MFIIPYQKKDLFVIEIVSVNSINENLSERLKERNAIFQNRSQAYISDF